MKIGDILYVKHENNTIFRTLEIVAETSRSWVCVSPSTYDWIKEAARRGDTRGYDDILKLPKNLKGFTLGTKQDSIIAAWASANKYQIAKHIEYRLSAAQLLEVAKTAGYTPLPEESNVTA